MLPKAVKILISTVCMSQEEENFMRVTSLQHLLFFTSRASQLGDKAPLRDLNRA